MNWLTVSWLYVAIVQITLAGAPSPSNASPVQDDLLSSNAIWKSLPASVKAPMKALLRGGPNAQLSCHDGRAPHAAAAGHLSLLSAVILSGWLDEDEANALPADLSTLRRALGADSRPARAAVRLLLDLGADPNTANTCSVCDGGTGAAPGNGFVEYSLMLKCGASGARPLHLAAAALDVELVRVLLTNGAKPDYPLPMSAALPHHLALQVRFLFLSICSTCGVCNASGCG